MKLRIDDFDDTFFKVTVSNVCGWNGWRTSAGLGLLYGLLDLDQDTDPKTLIGKSFELKVSSIQIK